jgi:hypothetical protein
MWARSALAKGGLGREVRWHVASLFENKFQSAFHFFSFPLPFNMGI